MNTTVLLGVVALLALNQAVMRLPWLWQRGAIFFGLLIVELMVGTALIVLGLPGFEHLPVVSWVVGLMFFLHTAQNLRVRDARLRAAQQEHAALRRAQARAAWGEE